MPMEALKCLTIAKDAVNTGPEEAANTDPEEAINTAAVAGNTAVHIPAGIAAETDSTLAEPQATMGRYQVLEP